jgi:hypothetical protein
MPTSDSVSSESNSGDKRYWLHLAIWRKRVLDRVVFTDLTLHSVITPTPLWQKGTRKGCRPADVTEPGFRKYWREKLSSLKSQCHDITNKYLEAASVVQGYRVLSDIEILAKCTSAKVGESSEWTSIVSSAEENRANFCKIREGKPLFSALYSI